MRAIQILLVEDNEGDIVLTKEAFEDASLSYNINVARDGKEGMQYLEKKGKFADAETPDMVLLDINLPKKNGHEVLHFIKSNDSLKHIPVIMLTTSNSENDVEKSYKNHANCHIIKPIEVEDFLYVMANIESFWINIARLPGKEKHK
ncbi:MAG TPA: response regulator [Cyclobacteriaceae bacterium]|nr:response regulator [Cyclobacteriaceae bacterium]